MIRIINLYIHDNLHSELLQSITVIVKEFFCLHNNDGSDDNAVKAGLMLHGQRKKDIRHFVNDNVSKDKQGDTSVRCSVRDYIDQL